MSLIYDDDLAPHIEDGIYYHENDKHVPYMNTKSIVMNLLCEMM